MKPLLISHCLLGEKVRYDGGHCLLATSVIKRLKREYELIPVCPEVMAGLSVPRLPIEIVDGRIRTKDFEDLTDLFIPVKKRIKKIVETHKIQRALLKERSPSCGSRYIYDGHFSGNLVAGEGIICTFLKELNVEVFSENEVDQLMGNLGKEN
ncbi:MAG: DUF523 domain-containing protein [Bacteriovoracaceae bacterium]|jgi:uncharacterized protein YbbK (DUF523 family)|nr:purine-nucleoside phosphorylase [Halobacteriovoraceae bacterium]MDP7320651.1 DUF523 domain-containing protein [Bacteriovoracaceae bacterium]|tara:strand:- start:478 stop:936 length:459 start_codon:yes stop_codon:yes gene_type:complete